MKKKKKTQNKMVVITPRTFKTVSFDVAISFPEGKHFSAKNLLFSKQLFSFVYVPLYKANRKRFWLCAGKGAQPP